MFPNIEIERTTVTHVKPGQYFIRNGAVYMRTDYEKKNWYHCYNYGVFQSERLGANATVYILPAYFNISEKRLALEVNHHTIA